MNELQIGKVSLISSDGEKVGEIDLMSDNSIHIELSHYHAVGSSEIISDCELITDIINLMSKCIN